MSEWIGPAEAGALLGVGPDRVAQLAREGTLQSMRTPGGHVRVRRADVEALAAGPEEDDPDEPPPTRMQSKSSPQEPAPRPRPQWENVAPWQRRVREAEADVEVLRLDDERERLEEEREQRQAGRAREDARRVAGAVEAKRLRGLRAYALECVPFNAPSEVKAQVARDLEHRVNANAYPASLGQSYAEALLKAEVERLLRPWRTREARQARVRDEGARRSHVISWAMLHVTNRLPRNWDWETRRDFERELKAVLEDEVELGMEQDEADTIGLEVLDEWMDEEEGE